MEGQRIQRQLGFGERLVSALIHRSAKTQLAGVRLRSEVPISSNRPLILYGNHHSWWDGYTVYLTASYFQMPVLLWAEELDAFPLFKKAGAMPFPVNDPATRAATLRQTIKRMRAEPSAIFGIFPEGKLHYPPHLLPFQPGFQWVCKHLPDALVVPMAIRHTLGLTEYPEIFVWLGSPLTEDRNDDQFLDCATEKLKSLMVRLDQSLDTEREQFISIVQGKKSINERYDFRKLTRWINKR